MAPSSKNPSTPTKPKKSPADLPLNPQQVYRCIEVTNANTHNLKSVSVSIPHRSLSVVTGVSGSGKSSLALDTIYAEGQRRYIESLSTYARQFLERLEKPDVEKIEHILPAVALEQNNRVTNARSTVGTVTEITDYIRMLFAHAGQVPLAQQLHTEDERHAKRLNISERKQKNYWLFSSERSPFGTVDGLAQQLAALPERTRLLIGVERVVPKGLKSKADWAAWVQPWLDAGYTRSIDLVSGEVVALDADTKPKGVSSAPLVLLVDRLIIKPDMDLARVREALQAGLALSQQPDIGQVLHETAGRIITVDVTDAALPHPRVWQYIPPVTLHPNQFSFNHPQGACQTCEGFGRVIGLDPRKIIPNPTISLADGAVHPFTMPANEDIQHAMMTSARQKGIATHIPYQQLSPEEKEWVWAGDTKGDGPYEGITPFFEWLETKRYKMHVRIFMAKYRGYDPCPVCEGSRLNALSRSVTIARSGLSTETFGSLADKPLLDLAQWLDGLSNALTDEERDALGRVIYEANSRINCLIHLGLGYLTLSRHSRTLSGGEMQRIQMASALGSWLTETLYVLDEPTVGLHPRDTERLLDVLKQLRDAGNTLLLVEHDPDVILDADFVMDMGPKAGRLGGELLYAGSPAGLLDCEQSATARELNKRQQQSNEKIVSRDNPLAQSKPTKPVPNNVVLHGPLAQSKPTKPVPNNVVLHGVTGHNVDHLTLTIPTGQLVVVTGVSGSGKSTLIKHGLYANAQHAQGKGLDLDAVLVERIEGLDQFAEVVMVDQTPPGRSQRSNPATYLKAYDGIRKLYGSTRRAKVHGLSASDFSFNRPGGRCEKCEGMGFLTIDMQFMADVTITCPQCRGRRFDQRVLAVDVNGKNIEDVLNMTVDEAFGFFKESKQIAQCLKPLQDIGLGYLQLGQSTSTLSGGEAQRLKLAAYLLETETKARRTAVDQPPFLFLFDEPTTGLHMQDIGVLLGVLRTLIERGHSVVVIEHHTDVMRAADHIIDMGPEGGDRGGRIVAQGTPDDIRGCAESVTGRYL